VNYYERHIGDYLKDTAHLSLLEHGIYGRLLDLYYTRETPIADEGICRLIGARTPDEAHALGEVLREFFTLSDGTWHHSRCDKEIERYRYKQQKAKDSANARWSKTGGNANAMRTHTDGNALQSPGTSNQTPVTKKKEPSGSSSKSPFFAPDWIPTEAWQDFVTMRKAIRGVPFTDAAAAGVVRELRKFCDEGFDATELLQNAVMNSWRTVYRPKHDARPALVAEFLEECSLDTSPSVRLSTTQKTHASTRYRTACVHAN